jgi:RNA polymerase sigma factor (sigma-70 family)
VDSSVSTWIALLKTEQEEAVLRLWERYFPQLVLLARDKLRGLSQGDADEEDLALSAFHTFYRAATSGRFPDLTNRDDLWRTLVLITTAKAVDRRRYQQAQKRGGASGSAEEELALLQEVVGQEPDPALTAQLVDECQTLLDRLNDDELQQIALLKLEGHTSEEIASQLNCSLRTVKRRLALIRRSWEAMAAEADG